MSTKNIEQLEQRQITIALPPEVWTILDGSNELAHAAGAQGFEEWVASLVLHSMLDSLNAAISSMSPAGTTGMVRSRRSREGNA